MWKQTRGPIFIRTRDPPVSPEHRAGRTGTRGPLPAAGPRQREEIPPPFVGAAWPIIGQKDPPPRADSSGWRSRPDPSSACPSVLPSRQECKTSILTLWSPALHPRGRTHRARAGLDAERGHRGECGGQHLSLPPATSSLSRSGRWKRKQENRYSMTLLAFRAGSGGGVVVEVKYI